MIVSNQIANELGAARCTSQQNCTAHFVLVYLETGVNGVRGRVLVGNWHNYLCTLWGLANQVPRFVRMDMHLKGYSPGEGRLN